MLELKNLSICVNNKFLIKNLNLNLNNGDKLAIIGEEGNGKSTLLKSILGICNYSIVEGNIDYKNNKIGYLEQSISDCYLEKSVYQYLFIDDNDYYNKINLFYNFIEKIKLDDSILKQKIKTLSGGEKIKICILKLLINDYDILFLDEPTNDLDIETLEWLEKFINNTNKPIIFVSHDETLLSNTANMILHIEQIKNKTECKHTLLKIDYNNYIEQRYRLNEKQTQIAKNEKREYIKQTEKLQKLINKVEYQQANISRKDPYGAKLLKKKMKSLKSQEKRINSTSLTEIPDVEESINLYFDNKEIPRNKVILNTRIKELKVSDKVLANNIELNIIGNKHICIIGNNGVGKSTLIRHIYNELKNRNDISIGYMPQNYEEVVSKYENVLDFMCPNGTKEDITKARLILGSVKFTNEEMTGCINCLSNGSKAKLFLSKLVYDKNNVLILDEPTRNISPLSNPVIRRILKEYKGTIISISHDRKYINDVINELYVLTKDGLIKKNNL